MGISMENLSPLNLISKSIVARYECSCSRFSIAALTAVPKSWEGVGKGVLIGAGSASGMTGVGVSGGIIGVVVLTTFGVGAADFSVSEVLHPIMTTERTSRLKIADMVL